MSHPFGDLLTRHLHRKHGLSQAKLAAGIVQDPSVVSQMCKGERLTGRQARERVIAIVGWLHQQGALDTADEANAMLAAAGLSALRDGELALAHAAIRREAARSSRAPTNLPAPLTSFIGREHEVETLRKLAATQRLITLTGAGGVGKTRLAIELGRALLLGSSAPNDGVWLVELASVMDGADLTGVIARAVRLPPAQNMTTELLCDDLRDMAMLIVLDNCEHLVDECARLVERLLQQCWQLRVLATTREPLQIEGEHVFRVPSLGLPDERDELDNPSAELFLARATEATTMFEADARSVAQICRALGGIPLAIELAAALTRTKSLADIAASLEHQLDVLASQHRTTIARHQTMRSAIAWSYNLLSPQERRLLTRLSVFVGGWTLEAAVAVCAANTLASNELSSDDVPSVLNALVDKSLVVAPSVDHKRFSLLEPVRQFARDQLARSDEEQAVRRAHATYNVELLELAQRKGWAEGWGIWKPILDRELANWDEAFRWAYANDTALVYRLVGKTPTASFSDRGVREIVGIVRATLKLPLENPTRDMLVNKVNVLNTGGFAECTIGEYRVARDYFLQVREIQQLIGDSASVASAIRGVAYADMLLGELSRASVGVEHSLAICRQAGEPRWIAHSLYDLGVIRYWQGDLTNARALAAEALEVACIAGDTFFNSKRCCSWRRC